jgi:putative Mg2+ transporter-C (MgtC) family protein
MDWQSQLECIGLVSLAGLLGGVIGLEREIAGKPAGLRTHILVGAAAALLMVVGEVAVEEFTADKYKIVIAIGVSFLGAGTIIHQRGRRIEGLTTAGSILFTAGIGVGVATRQYILATGLCLLCVVVLYVIGLVEGKITGRQEPPEKG